MKFKVENISCGHCVRAITEAVLDADVIATVNVDLAEKQVDVHSRLTPEQIQVILKEAGYPAQLID